MTHRYTTQVASDVIRDGLGVELLDESQNVVAEVFRSDRDRTVIVTTFSYDIPLHAIDLLLSHARERLDPFEDGASLTSAKVIAPTHIKPPK